MGSRSDTTAAYIFMVDDILCWSKHVQVLHITTWHKKYLLRKMFLNSKSVANLFLNNCLRCWNLMDCSKPLKNLKIKIHFSRYAFLFHRYILFLVNQNHFSNATSCEDTHYSLFPFLYYLSWCFQQMILSNYFPWIIADGKGWKNDAKALKRSMYFKHMSHVRTTYPSRFREVHTLNRLTEFVLEIVIHSFLIYHQYHVH